MAPSDPAFPPAPGPASVLFPSDVVTFAMRLAEASKDLLDQTPLTPAETVQAVALFAACVAGHKAQPGKADQVLSLMQLAMCSAADHLRTRGMWFSTVRPS